MNTRKYPRTLQEAFGPYTSREIQDTAPRGGYGWLWWALVSAISIVGVVVIGVTA